MRLPPVMVLLLALLVAPVTSAQEVTPAVPGQVTIAPGVATPVSTPVEDDPRLTICTAPTLEGFEPRIVRPGDRLVDFLTGASYISVTQLAALNCLDDPAALPVGAVIWVPASDAMDAAVASDDNSEAAIEAFSVSDEAIQNQSEVTFQWQASGAAAYFYRCPPDPDADCARPALAAPLPLAHELTLADFAYAGPARYRLEVEGGGQSVTEDITIDITCSQQWLGPVTGADACPPGPPLAVFAAWQPFEGGVMLWFSDTQQIWVLTNADHRIQVYADTFLEGEELPEIDTPDDLYAPVRGFGKVWQALGGPESDLGWALADETGFDSARQQAGTRSYTTYVQGPGETVYALTFIPGADTGFWARVAG